MKKRFYEIKNLTEESADLYIYGAICQENEADWWTGEKSETDIGLMDFKKEIDNLGDIKKLNIFINSPGGDVFVASTMISMLERLKSDGIEINAYVDGLSASAASFLMMVANHIYLYKNSVVMIHKPMSYAYGNSLDLQATIDMLDKIEESTIIPMYMEKSKVSEEEIKNFLAEEKWFSADEMLQYFDVELLTTTNKVAACIDKKLMAKYKNMPENILEDIKDFNIESNKDEKSKEQLLRNKLKLSKASLFLKEKNN